MVSLIVDRKGVGKIIEFVIMDMEWEQPVLTLKSVVELGIKEIEAHGMVIKLHESVKCPSELVMLDQGSNVIEDVCKEYDDVFVDSLDVAAKAIVPEAELDITGVEPCYVPPRPIKKEHINAVRDEISRMKRIGVIRETRSWNNAPLMVVMKKDGGIRLCLDYRALNKRTVSYRWALPRTDMLLRSMGGCSVFSKIDLASGYWQVPMKDCHSAYTSFSFEGKQYEFCGMPFGLKNAPAIFQRAMESVFIDEDTQDFITVYMDDICIFSRSIQEHMNHLRIVLTKCRDANVKLNRKKCVFGKNELDFLGHRISQEGIRTTLEKRESLMKIGEPSTVGELRAMLGLAGYYQNYIQGYAKIIEPLTRLLKKNCVFEWGNEQRVAWSKVCDELGKDCPLHCVDNTHDQHLFLTCDASTMAFGACLSAEKNGKRCPVMFISRRTSDAEQRYTNTERELAVIVWALRRMQYLISNHAVVVETDHAALIPLVRGDTKEVAPTNRCQRLLTKLAPWLSKEFTITHIAGKSNPADILSRPGERQDLGGCVMADGKPVCVLGSEGSSSDCTTVLTMDELRRCQEEDSEVLQWKTEVSDKGIDKSKEQYFVIRDGLLCISSASGNDRIRVVVPKAIREKALTAVHGVAHWGITTMKRMARRLIWWPMMNNDIDELVRNCPICMEKRVDTMIVPLKEPPFPPRPWHTIAVDLVALPATSDGYLYAFIAVDLFSRLASVIPLKSKKSMIVGKNLRNLFETKWLGPPTTLLCDRGGEFTSKLFGRLCMAYNNVSPPLITQKVMVHVKGSIRL